LFVKQKAGLCERSEGKTVETMTPFKPILLGDRTAA
jgi:hypothetical protein